MLIQNYMQDGASAKARAVLAILTDDCLQDVMVHRFENCREQGYFLYNGKNLVAFAENRNSDEIVIYFAAAVNIFGAPTNDILFDRCDYERFFFEYNQYLEAADYIKGLLMTSWDE